MNEKLLEFSKVETEDTEMCEASVLELSNNKGDDEEDE